MERCVVEEALIKLDINGWLRATPEETDQSPHRRHIVEEFIKQHRVCSHSTDTLAGGDIAAVDSETTQHPRSELMREGRI